MRTTGRDARLRAADARDIRAAAFDPYRGREIQPGAEVISDEAIDAFVRRGVESAYQPLLHLQDGRKNDPWRWSDRRRAYTPEALRIVDSSIMPSVTSAISMRRRS